MPPPRGRAVIEREAQRILERLSITDPPIDVITVAERLGYRVVLKFFDEADLSGTVMQDARGVVTIGINTLHAQVRQRFSIAHEIGHAWLHLAKVKREAFFVDPPAGVFFRDSKASRGEDPKEIEANQFAASLLLPNHIIDGCLTALAGSQKRLTVDTAVSELAAMFSVSTQAMRFRLVALGFMEPE
jgi:Zn-dependent peptidase ImmA (M78 family)